MPPFSAYFARVGEPSLCRDVAACFFVARNDENLCGAIPWLTALDACNEFVEAVLSAEQLAERLFSAEAEQCSLFSPVTRQPRG